MSQFLVGQGHLNIILMILIFANNLYHTFCQFLLEHFMEGFYILDIFSAGMYLPQMGTIVNVRP